MTGAEQITIQWPHQIALAVLGLAVLVLVFDLVRRGHLKERYALWWMGAALVAFMVGVVPRVIVWISHFLRFQFLTTLVLMLFGFLILTVLGFSVALSRLGERNRRLAQEAALLEERVRRIEEER